MNELDFLLRRLIDELTGILECAATINSEGVVSNRVGDFSRYEKLGIASALFGPRGDPLCSYRMATDYLDDRRMLPAGMSQGDLFAYVDILTPDLVVVALGCTDSSDYDLIETET